MVWLKVFSQTPTKISNQYPGSCLSRISLQTFFNIPHGTDAAKLTRKKIMEKKWYQIYTKSNTEKKLYKKILAHGFQVFIPIRLIKKKWCDRVKIIEEPALKSYLFAKLSNDDMRLVEKFKGFCFFVTYGCLNKSIRNQEMTYPDITDTTIKMISIILTEYPTANWKKSMLFKGNKVKFIEGSLKSFQGFIIQHLSEVKVAIQLPGLNQALIINVPMALLMKIT